MCVTLSCGHHYCNYCLDLLHSEMSHQCPQCSSPFITAQPNNYIDQQIDNLIHSCSESIQKAYVSALNSRFQKSMERNKKRRKEGGSYCVRNDCNEPKPSNCLDEIRNNLKMNDINPDHSVSRSLKSARNHRRAVPTPSNVVPGERQSSSRPRSKPLTMGSVNNVPKPYETHDAPEIDVDKVNMLFGIYDHVLGSDNEPNKEMASGDFVRDQNLGNAEATFLEGMQNFTQRSEVELQTLIKETDDIVKLDDHIQTWTNKMNDALGGGAESTGMADEKFDKNVRTVDDELWKASSELLQKLQGMQKQRKMAGKSSHISFSCPPTPLPRSFKLNYDVVSDDSDVEEYEQALENLQVCLDKSYDTSTQAQAHDLKQSEESQERGEIQRKKCSLQQEEQIDSNANNSNKSVTKNSSTGLRSARRKNILDYMEESGHHYVKENIEFITKMRKYKEALMKIHNREVVTAQEIKELVPTRIFPSDEQDAPTILKCGDVSTPRRLSQMRQGPRRPTARNPSYSARLPVSASMERRPMTATYELPATQIIHKQIAVAPSKQYLSRQRARASNSLFTAR